MDELNEKLNKKQLERSWCRVLNEFAKKMGVTPQEIIEQNKKNKISDIRKLYCKLRCEVHHINFSRTGREIGRSHTAVRHSLRVINDLLELNTPAVVEMWNKVKDIPGEYCLEKRDVALVIHNHIKTTVDLKGQLKSENNDTYRQFANYSSVITIRGIKIVVHIPSHGKLAVKKMKKEGEKLLSYQHASKTVNWCQTTVNGSSFKTTSNQNIWINQATQFLQTMKIKY